MLRFFRRLSPRRYRLYREEIQKRNLEALSNFIGLGLLVALINVLAQVNIHLTVTFVQSILELAYFLVAYGICGVLLKKKLRNGTLALYLIQIPIMIFGILMGTLWDRNNPTFTFLMFLILLPVFILDNPIRVECYSAALTVFYILMDWIFKDRVLFEEDVIHVLAFFLGSVCVSLFIIAERLDGVENYMISRYRAEHDEMTGLRNRYALKNDQSAFLDRNILVMLVDIDYFKFFNDMYGHNVGEEIIRIFSDIVREVFGEPRTYRYESDEVLVILTDQTEEEAERLVQEVRQRFRDITVKGKRFHPSCSCGYVYGKPRYDIDIREMIRHADIRLFEAKNQGAGRTVGHAYDNSSKRQTDILSEVGENMNRGTRDELTSLPNMQYFRIKASEMLANTVDNQQQTVFVYFNIENFKSYNEEYGFQKGDELLKSVAGIIRDEFQDRLISRFAEDHFVVMTYQNEVAGKLSAVERRVHPLFNKVDMSLRAGIYVYQAGDEVGLACDKAKLACDSIKRDYKRSCRYYDEELENRSKLEQYVITHIDEAVEKEYLRVYYQPIMDVSTGKLAELEALARWKDPVYGLLQPGEFIPALEDAHLIHKVDLYVAERVCQDIINLRDDREQAIPVSINLSRLDFMLTDIVSKVNSCVEAYKVPRGKIHIEITESALAEDYEELKKKVDELKNLGFETWLDDFGSGYSSFNALQDFRFDVIKVDMRFMRSFGSNPQTPIILTSIINMAKDLGMRSLVEGVETEEQFRFLKSIGTNYAQGYLFSKPIPLEELRRKYIDQFPGHSTVKK